MTGSLSEIVLRRPPVPGVNNSGGSIGSGYNPYRKEVTERIQMLCNKLELANVFNPVSGWLA